MLLRSTRRPLSALILPRPFANPFNTPQGSPCVPRCIHAAGRLRSPTRNTLNVMTFQSGNPDAAVEVASPDPEEDQRRLIEIWTDGSCRPNPGPGGWAAILRNAEGRTREVSGREADTTNNRMELRAAIAGLEALKRPARVTVYADSEYVVRGMTLWLPRWKRCRWRTAKGKPVVNADLWGRLAAAAEGHEVAWRWTQGHAGDPMNARADALANAARERRAGQ